MQKNDCIYVAGHTGMVGSAIVRRLTQSGYSNILTRTHRELDLSRQDQVEFLFEQYDIDTVFLAAARVGGIMANSSAKAEFYYQNAMIAQNVIHSSWKTSVKKLMNLGSSCIYPKFAKQPLKEESLLTGKLEETNEAYALAKLSAIKMCSYYNQQYGTDFLSVMPPNLFGIGDNFDLETSHVIPAMIRKFHQAKQNNEDVILWGDGSPLREFLYADDLADAVVFLMENYHASDLGEFINVGTGKECSIKKLSEMISDLVAYEGQVFWDTEKPNGTPQKLLDIKTIKKLGWEAQISLSKGLEEVYKRFVSSI